VPYVVANGVRLHVQRLGAVRSGAPVVMLHGLLVGNLMTWLLSAAAPVAARRPVVLYDLRGHGRSAWTASGYDVATMAADLAALVDEHPSVALVGHSYGALVALRFAIDHPGRVERLVLVEAPLPPSRVEEIDAFAGSDPGDMIAALPAGMREALATGGRRARRLVASVARLVRDSSLLADIAAEPDVSDAALATVACPVALVYGRDSACRSVGDRLARVIPGASLALLPGGHYLHLDCGSQLAACVTEAVVG